MNNQGVKKKDPQNIINLMHHEVSLTKYMPTTQRYETYEGVKRPVAPDGYQHKNQLRKLKNLDHYISWINGSAKQVSPGQRVGELVDSGRRYWILEKEKQHVPVTSSKF